MSSMARNNVSNSCNLVALYFEGDHEKENGDEAALKAKGDLCVNANRLLVKTLAS